MKPGQKLFSLVLAGALFLQVGLPAAQAAGEQSQAQQYAQQVAYQTKAEGIVLLKNENNCLPLEGKRVNVFGAASVKPYYGGGGFGQIDSSDVTDFYAALEQAGVVYNTELKSAYARWSQMHSLNLKEMLGAKDFFSFGAKLLFGSVAKVEMPVNRMTAKVKRNAKKYSDTAIFYYGRSNTLRSTIRKPTASAYSPGAMSRQCGSSTSSPLRSRSRRVRHMALCPASTALARSGAAEATHCLPSFFGKSGALTAWSSQTLI